MPKNQSKPSNDFSQLTLPCPPRGTALVSVIYHSQSSPMRGIHSKKHSISSPTTGTHIYTLARFQGKNASHKKPSSGIKKRNSLCHRQKTKSTKQNEKLLIPDQSVAKTHRLLFRYCVYSGTHQTKANNGQINPPGNQYN